MSGRSQYYKQYDDQRRAVNGDDYADRSETSFSTIIGALQKQKQKQGKTFKNGILKR